MSKINGQMQKENKKSQMKISVELQAMKYLVFCMVFERENVIHMNGGVKDGGVNMVV